jgi:transposase
LKISACVLDPLGLPITTTVVPGNTADDPLYIPEIKKVNETFGKGGKTFFGDCKMAALDTRAFVANTQDFYVCPLALTQLSRDQRRALLAPVFSGQQKLKSVYRPAESPDREPELVAQGFSYDVALSAEVEGRLRRWKERRWLVQSQAFAASEAANLEARLEKATTQLGQLLERKQGKKRLNAAELQEAGEDVIKKHRVEGLLEWQVQTTIHEKVVRRYGDRSEHTTREEEHRGQTSRCEEAIALAKREMGWQVYATNNLKLNEVAVVWGYRGQYQIEQGWSRLKGCPLSLTPMFLATDNRMEGLVLLLSLALRVLTLLGWVVRKKLEESGEALKGVYPAQPGRRTKTPSAEMLLKVFRGISLTFVELAGQISKHVTPLNPLQKRLLELWDFPPDLFQLITLHSPKPPPELSEL